MLVLLLHLNPNASAAQKQHLVRLLYSFFYTFLFVETKKTSATVAAMANTRLAVITNDKSHGALVVCLSVQSSICCSNKSKYLNLLVAQRALVIRTVINIFVKFTNSFRINAK